MNEKKEECRCGCKCCNGSNKVKAVALGAGVLAAGFVAAKKLGLLEERA